MTILEGSWWYSEVFFKAIMEPQARSFQNNVIERRTAVLEINCKLMNLIEKHN